MGSLVFEIVGVEEMVKVGVGAFVGVWETVSVGIDLCTCRVLDNVAVGGIPSQPRLENNKIMIIIKIAVYWLFATIAFFLFYLHHDCLIM